MGMLFNVVVPIKCNLARQTIDSRDPKFVAVFNVFNY
jgi:hypothetical protein